MYRDFFGLKESPFSIAPNPEFLYLSDSHREALAHLLYGLGDTGGFVLLTGEVGTGKTTLSRSLLRQLSDETDVAFILNPALTEVELLATVCDQLNIDYNKDVPQLKGLIDGIHGYLMRNHEQGRNTLLMIDEAQQLSVEALEQLRLLTNLETDTRKLLRVVLIGQPELAQMLRQPMLRQLVQRITARYHLVPLSVGHTRGYIAYRLQQAGCERPLFSAAQVKWIHQMSGGIPRLINLVCDRALLAAYGRNQMVVDHRALALAIKETELVAPRAHPWSAWMVGLHVGLVVLVAALSWFYFNGWPSFVAVQATANLTHTLENRVDALPASEAARTAIQTPSSSVEDEVWQQQWPSLRAKASSLGSAVQLLYRLWGFEVPLAQASCQLADAVSLSCYTLQGDLDRLVEINYPGVVTLTESGHGFYGVVRSISEDAKVVTLWLGDKQLQVSRQWFESHWDGRYNLMWQPPTGFSGVLREGSEGAAVLWLEERVSLAVGERVRYITRFDQTLAAKVRRFQAEQALHVDGMAGTFTLLKLSQLLYISLPSLQGEH
jgi:general secretion pathway protein A